MRYGVSRVTADRAAPSMSIARLIRPLGRMVPTICVCVRLYWPWWDWGVPRHSGPSGTTLTLDSSGWGRIGPAFGLP